jgi:heme a synthase
VLSASAMLVYRSSTQGYGRLAAILLVVALCAQVILGISTLLLHVPVALGTAHQGGAVLLLTAALFLSHVQLRQ